MAVAASLALLAALTLAAPAGAGVGKYRVGVVTGPPVESGDLDRMASARVKTARIIFSWDAIETERRSGRSCGSAEYGGLEQYDRQVLDASKRGMKILPMIFDSPGYAGGRSHRMPSTKSRAIEDYKCFLRTLVHRYGPGGGLMRGNRAARPITEWQVWNEPNLPIYTPTGKPDPKEYARFVKITSSEIRRIDRGATIVLGGMPEKSLRGVSSKRFLTAFYRVPRIEKTFDVLALHPYAKNAQGVEGALIRLRDLLRRVGDANRVIWLTEVGYATDGPKGHFLVDSEKGQARKLVATLRFLKKNHGRFNVGTVHWFRWRDQATYKQNTGVWPDYAGLYRKNGSPKPSCEKFRDATGAGGGCKPIKDPPESTGPVDEILDMLPVDPRDLIPSPPE